jgi:hypothetical protein
MQVMQQDGWSCREQQPLYKQPTTEAAAASAAAAAADRHHKIQSLEKNRQSLLSWRCDFGLGQQ